MHTADPFRRARRWFWALLLTAVLAMGALYAALGGRPGPATGLAVAASSVVLLAATVQAARIMLAVERVRRSAMATRPTDGAATAPGPDRRSSAGGLADRVLGRRAGSAAERSAGGLRHGLPGGPANSGP